MEEYDSGKYVQRLCDSLIGAGIDLEGRKIKDSQKFNVNAKSSLLVARESYSTLREHGDETWYLWDRLNLLESELNETLTNF